MGYYERHVLPRRLNPLRRRIGGGRTLDRDIPAPIEAAGFRLEALERAEPPRTPRFAAFNTCGAAGATTAAGRALRRGMSSFLETVPNVRVRIRQRASRRAEWHQLKAPSAGTEASATAGARRPLPRSACR